MIERIDVKMIMRRRSGSLMCLASWNSEQPSMRAASITSSEIEVRAVR